MSLSWKLKIINNLNVSNEVLTKAIQLYPYNRLPYSDQELYARSRFISIKDIVFWQLNFSILFGLETIISFRNNFTFVLKSSLLRPLVYSNIFGTKVSKWGKITIHKVWSGTQNEESMETSKRQDNGQWMLFAFRKIIGFVGFF